MKRFRMPAMSNDSQNIADKLDQLENVLVSLSKREAEILSVFQKYRAEEIPPLIEHALDKINTLDYVNALQKVEENLIIDATHSHEKHMKLHKFRIALNRYHETLRYILPLSAISQNIQKLCLEYDKLRIILYGTTDLRFAKAFVKNIEKKNKQGIRVRCSS